MSSRHKILLVDDNKTSLKLLKALYEVDYEVITANDGMEALEFLFQQTVDLIITDVLMPNMDGYYLCYRIRTKEKLKDIPIIIYTATYTSLSEEKIAKEMGANIFIRKPASIKLLLSSVEELLAQPQNYPHKIPTRHESTEMMHHYSAKLITKLEQNNIELEEIKTKLQDSESRLKRAQAIAHIGHWELDFATGIANWSEESCRIYGLHIADNQQSFEVWLSFIHPDDMDFVMGQIKTAEASLSDNSFDHRIVRRDGSIRYLHTESKFELDANGKPTGLYGITQDITKIRQMEDELRKSELNLRTIFENTDVGFLLMDTKYSVIAANAKSEQWAKTLLAAPLSKGMNMREKLIPESVKDFDQMMSIVLKGGQINYEVSYPAAQGVLNWFHVTGKPVVENGGKVSGICLAVNNITERVLAEQELKTVNGRLLFNLENSPLGFIEWDNQLMVKSASKRTEEIFGWSEEELLNDHKNGYSRVFEEDLPEATEVAQHLLAGNITRNNYRNRNYTRDGRVIWCEWFNSVIKDKNGKVETILSLVQDVTEKKLAEIQKEFDGNNLDALINNTTDLMWSVDKDFNLITSNRPFDEMSKINFGRIIEKGGNVLSVSFTPETLAHFRSQYEKAFAGEVFTETEHFEASVEIWSEISYYPILKGNEVVGTACHSRDITETKKALRKVEESEKRFRALIENSGDMLSISDASGQFQYTSPNILKFLGYNADNLIKTRAIEIIHPDEIDDYTKTSATVRQNPGKSYHFVKRMKHANGSWLWMEGTKTNLLHIPAINGVITNFRDITARKKAENEISQLNEHLEERVQERTAELTEANKALEAFSSAVSHDLRAPVRAVNSFAKIIQKDYGEKLDPEVMELFNHIIDSGKRMSAIIEDLLKLAKYGKEKLKSEPVDMSYLVNGVWLNINRTTNHKATLELAELPQVQADMSMIQQVLVNLLSNAIKYSSKKEKPVIKVWAEQKKENITFYFKDNGAGFDMKNYDRLFGAFQRFHSARDFEGTGVGLTLVKRIIENHGGTVGAEAIPGKGATFWFTLPLK